MSTHVSLDDPSTIPPTMRPQRELALCFADFLFNVCVAFRSPLFWAQYEREYVHDSRCHLDPRPTPEIYHPAFFQRIVVSEDELKHVRNRGGDRHLHPAFNGQREFPSSCFDRLEFHIDEDSGTSDSEVEETMVERRMKMGRVHARINAELAKELNVAGHPIYTGYKSMPPVFQGEVQYVHPAFFGFSPNERFQTRSVVEVSAKITISKSIKCFGRLSILPVLDSI